MLNRVVPSVLPSVGLLAILKSRSASTIKKAATSPRITTRDRRGGSSVEAGCDAALPDCSNQLSWSFTS